MAELSENQIEYVNKICDARRERDNGNFDKTIQMLNELWDGIPEPKYEYSESYLVAWDMMDTAIITKNTELMREWLPHIFKSDLERYDNGDREMYAGIVEYECGNMEKSFGYFDIAKKKSSSRCFRKTDRFDKKYGAFYKEQAELRKADKKSKK